MITTETVQAQAQILKTLVTELRALSFDSAEEAIVYVENWTKAVASLVSKPVVDVLADQPEHVRDSDGDWWTRARDGSYYVDGSDGSDGTTADSLSRLNDRYGPLTVAVNVP